MVYRPPPPPQQKVARTPMSTDPFELSDEYHIVFVRNKGNTLLSLNSISIHLSCYAFLSNLSVRSSKLAALFGSFRRP